MVEVEIDGKKVEVAEGSTVLKAAQELGIFVPHFCYHKKLSIAANCRMCLVQVEKAPKPAPACATPVAPGMKVWTHSEQAVRAQKGVMEFLLINHPLDCPICDQGGECQLQDLAVGYGNSASRYQEEKRVVLNKNLGPLISTDMTRCIHCTRCVRFGQEIAGIMELGVAGRGEHSEILTFMGRAVSSELSGNVIDLCPVGALTSKPFRFAARTWELARRRTVSPHDSLGATLIAQVKGDEVVRVLPLENEEVNECWIADRDRFSYEALRQPHRLNAPMLKQNGAWTEVDWQTALEYVAHAFRDIAAEHGKDALGFVASPHSTLEELYLMQRLARGLGSENIDFRLRQSDFSLDGVRSGVPWLGMNIAEISRLDGALVIGSFLRKDHPLLCQRLRQIAKRGARITAVHAAQDDWLLPVETFMKVAPSAFPVALLEILKAVCSTTGASPDTQFAAYLESLPVSDEARRIAESLCSARNGALLLGNFAQHHPDAGLLHSLALEIARCAGQLRVGILGEAANSVGGYVAGACPSPGSGGRNARMLWEDPCRAYLLLNAEPRFDCADPAQALSALSNAEHVVVLTPFVGEHGDYADCLLPIAPFTETSGSFVNTEGRVQSFRPVAQALAQSRPGWKVLRVLGNLLSLPEFEFESSEQIRDSLVAGRDVTAQLSNDMGRVDWTMPSAPPGLERVSDIPIYRTDAVVRRASALQACRDGTDPVLRIHPATASEVGLSNKGRARVKQGGAATELSVQLDEGVARGCVRIAAACEASSSLGPMFGPVTVEAC
ncbi:MAG: NADH-quinone oxidoreductase chain 3 [Rhodocyclaceae bacterium]|jgi:NADH-quinone oxidoreductase subunit G|nr:NADH-quinone oxidoreductase chain 3 [Rhodocyclaceae bacterium]